MRQEIAQYGRTWIWEGYFNPANKEKWEKASDSLKHVNDHVL
jgi:hypothetical protein